MSARQHGHPQSTDGQSWRIRRGINHLPRLGALLLFSGLELALSAKPQDYRDGDLFLVLLMAAIGVAVNPAAAFAVGVPLAFALRRRWLRI